MNTSQASLSSQAKVWLSAVAMVLVAAIVIVALVRERIINQIPYQVSVVGRSEITYEPDMAIITFGVQVDKAQEADQALKQLNDKMNAVYTAITDLGITSDDVSTQNYSLYPQYDYINNANTVTGYNANQTVEVTVHAIDENENAVTQVVGAVAEAGVNQVNGIRFETSQYDEFKEQARLDAIADARSKAQGMAQVLGVELDKVVGWWENIVYPQPYETQRYYSEGGYGGGGGAGSPVIPAGSQEMIVEVNVNYVIK